MQAYGTEPGQAATRHRTSPEGEYASLNLVRRGPDPSTGRLTGLDHTEVPPSYKGKDFILYWASKSRTYKDVESGVRPESA